MPIDVQRLAEVVRVFNQARTDPEPSGPDALERVREDLRGLAREALDDDPEMIPVVVNLIHLLLEVRDGAVPEDAAAEGLRLLESSLSRGFLAQDWAELMVPLVLRGGDIEEAPGSDDRAGCSLMRWRSFCDHHAAAYGRTKFSSTDLEDLWDRVERGKIEVLESALHLGEPNRVVWFTDEATMRGDCPTAGAGSRLDAGRAYDRLGLDWSRRWEGKDDQGHDSARAVLLSVSLERRLRAAGGSHATTALDGWGCLGFVPGDLRRGGPWPAVGSFTVNPVDGRRGLPEGVHGPLVVDAAGACPVEGCGRVAKSVSDRLEECGKDIVERALARL